MRAVVMMLTLWWSAQLQAAPVPIEQQAVHVLNRIAYGPRPGDIERVSAMGVRRYIDSQLESQPASGLDNASAPLPPTLQAQLDALEVPKRQAGAVLGEFLALRRDVRDEEEGARQRRQQGLAAINLQTAQARVLRALDSPRQLEEVMVEFWFNHFNVFSDKGETRALIASYERDAIRPYVFGRFRDMLGATAKHPAMLYYLDNVGSRRGGVNENYARELMELHTLGVGHYSQQDVTQLARMLTGWTYERRALVQANEGFRFDARRHEPGAKRWLGRQVEEGGQAEGEYALDVLASHPATARRLSFKLAQYLVQDDPPPALVERIALAWQDSGGNLRKVLRALLTSEEFLAPASMGAKFKTPYQFVLSAARAAGTTAPENILPLLGAMRQLGMPLYGCPTPDGYQNTEAAWLNPDALPRRIGFAQALAEGRLKLGGAAPGLDVDRLAATLGSAVSAPTHALVAAQPPRLRPALLLGSPDFMQR